MCNSDPFGDRYVSSVAILSSDPSKLLSGGGDDSLFLWDWMSGEIIAKIPIVETVRRFQVIKGGRANWKAFREGGRGSGTSSKKKKEQGAFINESMSEGASKPDDDGALMKEVKMDVSSTPSSIGPGTWARQPDEDVMIVSNIQETRLSDGINATVFTALGYGFLLATACIVNF
jgi:WD40 repeat protein